VVDEYRSIVPILNWFDGPVRQSFQSVFDGINATAEALDLFNKFRKKHLESLISSVERVKILGMSEPIPLLDIYSPAFVSTTIHSRLYEKNWFGSDEPNNGGKILPQRGLSNVVSADAYIEAHDKVVVLGGPGSGKTTLLKYLALAYGRKEVFRESSLKTSKLPIYISLLTYSNQDVPSTSIVEHIIAGLRSRTNKYAEDFMRRTLEKGLAVILLDALDEVPRREYPRNCVS